jgi:hypothetical protein
MSLFLTPYSLLLNFKIRKRELEKALTTMNNIKPQEKMFLLKSNLQIGNAKFFIDKHRNKKPNYSDFAIF